MDIDSVLLEQIFRGVISVGVAVMIYLIKDFKADIKKLTEGLSNIGLSLQTLITKDTHKDDAIRELKERLDTHQDQIQQLQIDIAVIKQKEHE